MNAITAQPSSHLAAEQHTLPRTLVLHLTPGIIITAALIIVAYLTAPLGWPASLALLVTWPIAGIPLLFGILLYHGRKLNGRLSLQGVLLYREPLPVRQYGWLVPALLIWSAVWSTLLTPVGETIRQTLFGWWPSWLNLSAFAQNLSGYPSSILWAVVALSAILNVAVPITEELYFRSFLLPRLARWGAWAPILSAVLFSLYHFWLPWDNLGRITALLPVVFTVWWKRNVYVSIWVHCLLNSLGTIGLLALVLSQGKLI